MNKTRKVHKLMLYDYPEYYETAFSFRNIEEEALFLHECIKRFSKIDVHNIFEIGCGNAPHAGMLTNLGYNYHGLDLNRNMLDYAAYQWKDLPQKIKLHEANMIEFKYPVKQDFAFVMLGSLYLNNYNEITSHFDSMGRLLNKNGLYFLDWCIQFGDPLVHNDNNKFTIEKNGIKVESEFKIKLLDKEEQMYEEVWTIKINDRGRHKQFNMIERNKAILPEQFLQFIKNRDDFKFIGWWKDWDFNHPIENNDNIIRPIALIQKI